MEVESSSTHLINVSHKEMAPWKSAFSFCLLCLEITVTPELLGTSLTRSRNSFSLLDHSTDNGNENPKHDV